MYKSNGKNVAVSEIDKISSVIIYTKIELRDRATELKQLSKNTVISAEDFVKNRRCLSNIIENLSEELEVLEERFDAVRLGDAQSAHEDKVNGVRLVLKSSLALMEELDEDLEDDAEDAREIRWIDVTELDGDIAGIDARLDLLRKQWVHVDINASLTWVWAATAASIEAYQFTRWRTTPPHSIRLCLASLRTRGLSAWRIFPPRLALPDRQSLDYGRQTSITAGTAMHSYRLSLTIWFWVAYLMTTHSNGMSARQL